MGKKRKPLVTFPNRSLKILLKIFMLIVPVNFIKNMKVFVQQKNVIYFNIKQDWIKKQYKNMHEC